MHPELTVGSWSFSTYYAIISLDFCLMLWWLKYRSQKLGFPAKKALDTGIIATLAGLMGARLFHVFYEYPEFYLENPSFIFKLWEGGFVVLPGFLLAILTGVWWLRRTEKQVWPWLDLFAPVLALGYSVGRWACFFQGCCYGKSTDSFLGVHFPHLHQSGESLARYPTQIFASMGELFIFLGLLFLERSAFVRLRAGQLFSVWIVGHGINRFVMEIFRDDPRGPLLFGMGVSFWIAGLMVLVGLMLMKKQNSQSLIPKK